MRILGTLLIASTALTACSKSETESPVKAVSQIETRTDTATTKTTEALKLNYCHAGPAVKQKTPVHSISMQLPIYDAFKNGPMKRIQESGENMSKDAAAGIAPSEDAFKRHGLATGALGILIDRNLQDQNAQLNLIFCNFETYAKDKCASPASRNFIKSATLGANGEALTFITNKDATVTLAQPYTKFGRRHYGDLTIKMDGVKSQWTRTVGGVESFTTTATNGVRSWTENPDCSGKLDFVSDDGTLKLDWNAPSQNDVSVRYDYCDQDGCLKGKL